MPSARDGYRTVTDQMGRKVILPHLPTRIISLVPSQTELLFDLDLADHVVGITKFCVHPDEMFRSKPRVGGTKNYHFDKIRALKPDLIIGNKEENEEQQILQLAEEFPVWMSDIKNLADAGEMIHSIGTLLGKASEAANMVKTIASAFSELNPQMNPNPLRVLYLIWQKPFMAAGPDTFIHQMIGACGWSNCFSDPELRYPEVTSEAIHQLQPDLILLSSEPFPFKEKQRKEIQHQFPSSKVILVDGEMFSWYGSRLLQAPKYFASLQTASKSL